MRPTWVYNACDYAMVAIVWSFAVTALLIPATVCAALVSAVVLAVAS